MKTSPVGHKDRQRPREKKGKRCSNEPNKKASLQSKKSKNLNVLTRGGHDKAGNVKGEEDRPPVTGEQEKIKCNMMIREGGAKNKNRSLRPGRKRKIKGRS